MRVALIAVPYALFLCSCSVVPHSAWTFDPTQPQGRAALPAEDASMLTNRVAELQVQRTEIRTRIANEPDAFKRQQHYEALHAVGMQLSPLERRLATVASAR